MFKIVLSITMLVSFLNTFEQAFAQSSNCSFENCPVTKSSYDETINNLKDLYPSLVFKSSWEVDELQASALKNTIFLSGGFARKENITLGGFITVACHEVGHAFSSLTEGAADYFATSECMKRLFNDDENINIINVLNTVSEPLVNRCLNRFSNLKDAAICVRVINASVNAANLDRIRCVSRIMDLKEEVLNSPRASFHVSEFYYRCLRTEETVNSKSFIKEDLKNLVESLSTSLEKPLVFSNTDKRRVSITYHAHNSPLCRIETLINGALELEPPACWFSANKPLL